MSLEATLARIAELNSALSPAPPAPPPTSGTSFAGQLQGAMATQPAASAATAAPAFGGGAGGSMVQIAAGEVGQAESPPGSNNSPRIAQYRSATAGNPGVGPWCAYFVSWVSKMAGKPIGESGQGFGSVDAVYAWAQRAGRAVPGSSGQRPNPGDLIVWDEHIGLVESVEANGTIHTIEGNSSDRVSRRAYAPGSRPAIGYVRMS